MANNQCRLCLENCSEVLPIFQKKNGVLLAKLTDILQIRLQVGNGLPGVMCANCVSRLDAAYSFKQQCLESQRQLKRQTMQAVRKASSGVRARRLLKKYSETDSGGSARNDSDDVETAESVPDDLGRSPGNTPIRAIYLSSSIGEGRNNGEGGEGTTAVKEEPGVSLECGLCDARFASGVQLENHLNTHEEKKDKPPPKCLVCKKTFASQSGLRTHMVTHVGDSAVQCTRCDKVFLNGTYLKHHLELSHSRGTTSGGPAKSFSCATCGKSFLKQAHLIEHTRIHTGDRPFKCVACDKRFTTKCNLTRHTRTHVVVG